MTEGNALLSCTVPPNTWRVVNTRNFHVCFSKTYPEMLRGIMQEGEFVDYLKRIEEALYSSNKMILLILGPLPFFALIPILICVVGSFVGGMVYGFCWIVITVCMWLYYAFIMHRNRQRALVLVEEILGEINQRYYSRGVRWMFNDPSQNDSIYIDITFFNSNTTPQATVPNAWTSMSYSSIGTPTSSDLYLNSSTYSQVPSAPPPMVPDSSSIITDTEIGYSGDSSLGYTGDFSAGY